MIHDRESAITPAPVSSSQESSVISVPAERALEYITVDEASSILKKLSKDVESKQTELRSMVSSRYHELIESADNVIAMQSLALDIRSLLAQIEHGYHEIITLGNNVAKSVLNANLICDEKKVGSTGTFIVATKSYKHQLTIKLLLNAPGVIWKALERGDVLYAMTIFIRCATVMENRTLNHLENNANRTPDDTDDDGFIETQWACMRQFPLQIYQTTMKSILHESLSMPNSMSSSFNGILDKLATLVIFERLSNSSRINDSVSCYTAALDSFFSVQEKAFISILREAKTVPDKTQHLTKVLKILYTTIISMHTAFSNDRLIQIIMKSMSFSKSCDEQKTDIIDIDVLRLKVSSWLCKLLPKIEKRITSLLKTLETISEVSHVCGILWSCTHYSNDSFSEFVNKEAWKNACNELVDRKMIENDIPVSNRNFGKPQKKMKTDGELDLWTVLFDRTFDELGERIVFDTVNQILVEFLHEIDVAVEDIVQVQPHGEKRSCSDIVEYAHKLCTYLEKRVSTLCKDTENLLKEGDDVSGDSIRWPFYLRITELAAGLLIHLRKHMDSLISMLETFDTNSEHEDHRRAEAVISCIIFVGRMAWLLHGKKGNFLRNIFIPPAKTSKFGFNPRMNKNVVGCMQMEASFEIADMNGDGILEGVEIVEAFQAICGENEPMFSRWTNQKSLNYSEFALLATPILEKQEADVHLMTGLNSLMNTCTSLWAKFVTALPFQKLKLELEKMIMCSTEPQYFAMWRDYSLILDIDDGTTVTEKVNLPTSVTVSLQQYILRVSFQFSTIFCGADLSSLQLQHQPKPFTSFCCSASHSLAQICRNQILGLYQNLLKNEEKFGIDCEKKISDKIVWQFLLDALYLECLPGWEFETLEVSKFVGSYMDPIDLQTYRPILENSAESCFKAVSSLLALPGLQRKLGSNNPPQRKSNISLAETSDLSHFDSTNIIVLAKRAHRLELLPLPSLSKEENSAKTSPVAESGINLDSNKTSIGEEFGLQAAGRQALAGLIGQVGSVHSALQGGGTNIFGAATSLWSLGMQRK